MVEHLTFNQVVLGSSPSALTINPLNDLRQAGAGSGPGPGRCRASGLADYLAVAKAAFKGAKATGSNRPSPPRSSCATATAAALLMEAYASGKPDDLQHATGQLRRAPDAEGWAA